MPGIGLANPSSAVRTRVLLVVVFLLFARVAGAATVRVATGAQSPLGLPFSAFSGVSLAGDDRVAFIGASTGAFRRQGNALTHVVAAGDVLGDGRVVAGVGNPVIGPGGCVAVRAFLVDGGSRLLRRCGGLLDVIVATGAPAPGGGIIADLLTGTAYGPGGEIAFTALLDDGGIALLRAVGTTLTRMVRTGDTSPAGGTLVSLRLVGVSVGGVVGYRGAVSGGRDGLFAASGDQGSVTTRPVVVVGDASFAGGGTFTQLSGATLNDSGVWAFRGVVSVGRRAGVFRADASGPVVIGGGVALEDDAVGGSAGVTLRQLPSSLAPSINASGAVAFRASLGGAETGSAIFVAAPNAAPTRILSTRDPTAVGALVRFRDPAMADDGSVVVSASITGSGPGLFIYRAGVVSALAKLGDATDVDAGQERFRFATASVRTSADDAVFLGSREGIFLTDGASPIERLAFIGGPTPLGGTYASFDPPAIDAGGVVAFGAEIKDGRASRAVVSVNGKAEARVVAATTGKVPGGGQFVDFFAGTIDSLARSDVGPHGEIAFEATVQGSSTPRGLFMRNGTKKVRVLARARKRAPGGGTFDSFGTPALLGGNRLAFVAQVDQDETRATALFARVRGPLRRIALAGDTAPGRVAGRFEDFDPPDASASLVACRATLTEGGREGIYVTARKGFGLLVGTGDPSGTGPTFRSFGRPIVSDGGVAFLARLTGSIATPTLFRVAGTTVPSASAAAPEATVVVGPGTPSPLGGSVSEILAVDGNRQGGLVVIADLVGASARSAILADLP
jgi:hypothetical protein